MTEPRTILGLPEIRPAFLWNCEACGAENLLRIEQPHEIQHDGSGVVTEVVGDDLVIKESDDGEFDILANFPETLTCDKCGVSYREETEAEYENRIVNGTGEPQHLGIINATADVSNPEDKS